MKQKKLVIIGGGFAGALVAKNLEDTFETTLIDKKGYFEYTPGILRSIVDPDHLEKIQVSHEKSLNNTKVIKGEVQTFNNKYVVVKGKKITFDYLVISSGTKYSPPIKSNKIIMTSNAKTLKNNYEKLCKAKNVCIVGGGLVGIEFAAEIAKKYHKEIKNKEKILTLIQSQNTLIPRQPKRAQRYASQFLKKCGVIIHYNKRATEKELNDEKKGPDMIFMCTGITPNSNYIDKKLLNNKGYVKVNDYLQVEGKKNIFAGGDVTNINEEKLAQNAEKHAKIITKNILNSEENNDLVKYQPKERVIVISLGKYSGIFVYKNITLTGFLPGMLKNIIEKMIVREYA